MRTLPKRAENENSGFFVTPFANNVMSFCGHKIDVHRLPKSNCEQCWAFFFMQNVEFTQSVAKVLLSADGERVLTSEHGAKFVKKAKWFFAAVARAKEISDKVEAEKLQDKEYDIVISSDLAREQFEKAGQLQEVNVDAVDAEYEVEQQ